MTPIDMYMRVSNSARFEPNLFRTGMLRAGMFRSDIGMKHAMFHDIYLSIFIGFQRI